MDSSLIFPNALNSPVLFFSTGMTAVKANLEIFTIPQLVSLCLLFTVCLKGNHERHTIGLTPGTALALVATVGLAASIYSFFILRFKLDLYNAAEVSAAYGSMRAVTLVTASSVRSGVNVDFCGPVVAALALMESPASIVNLLLRVRVFAHRHNSQKSQETFDRSNGLRKSWLDRAVLLSMGSLLMGQVWPGPLGFCLTSPSVFRFTFHTFN